MYILTRAELLYTLCFEIPCIWFKFLSRILQIMTIVQNWPPWKKRVNFIWLHLWTVSIPNSIKDWSTVLLQKFAHAGQILSDVFCYIHFHLSHSKLNQNKKIFEIISAICRLLICPTTIKPFILCRIETVQDFLIKLGIKPLMHLVERSTFSRNNVIGRLTQIMNRADKNWAHF